MILSRVMDNEHVSAIYDAHTTFSYLFYFSFVRLRVQVFGN